MKGALSVLTSIYVRTDVAMHNAQVCQALAKGDCEPRNLAALIVSRGRKRDCDHCEYQIEHEVQ